MKKKFSKAILAIMACALFFTGCGKNPQEKEKENDTAKTSSLITDHDWQASGDESLITCETDGTFKYYRSAEDLTNNYFEGTYEFFMGEEAVTYITTTLSDYNVTEKELEDIFDRNEQYEEDNFVCLVLNNEKCIMDGVNQIDKPYQTPYFGFCLEEDGTLCLDLANMNTGNYSMYIAK